MPSENRILASISLCVSLATATTLVAGLATAQIKIDVKTALGQKEKTRLAKAGLIGYLRQSEWAEVVNIGEDFAVWIENFRRRIKVNTVRFELDLELRTKADLGSGKLIATRHIADTVDLAEVAELKTFEERELYRLVEKQLTKGGKLKPLTTALGVVAGTSVPMAGPVIEQGLKYFGLDLNAQYTADEAVEGMVLGAALLANLKEMLDEAGILLDD